MKSQIECDHLWQDMDDDTLFGGWFKCIHCDEVTYIIYGDEYSILLDAGKIQNM